MDVDRTLLRRIAIEAQGLNGSWDLPAGKEGVAGVIERLGHVQIDTISVVERAHHHVLWTRCPDYTHAMLHDLQSEDRRIFEYWFRHVACFLPMREYRFYRRRFRRLLRKDYDATTRHVMRRIKREGGLGSADFQDPSGRKRGPWWDWKPAKRSLERLFDAGHVMVGERRGFQRIYDLPERVIPKDLDLSRPRAGEMTRFRIRSDIRDQGFEPCDKWKESAKNRRAIRDMEKAGEVIRLRYKDTEIVALAEACRHAMERGASGSVHILSPFDGLLRARRRVEWLFGFQFRLEAYTPESKRRWGYFCLPLLWGDRLVGRFDPKADRASRTFIVKRLIFEEGFNGFDAFLPLFARKLRAFAAFNGCDTIELRECIPRNLRAAVRKALR